MRGREIAYRTLCFERLTEPCIVGDWVFHDQFFRAVTGRSVDEDPLQVAVEAFRRVGANLMPQFAVGSGAHFFGGTKEASENWIPPEQIKREIESLPSPDTIERAFDFESVKQDYWQQVRRVQDAAADDILRIAWFGQPDFMGGYTRWGYQNYLEAMALYPEHMRRYYEHSGEHARLCNMGIAQVIGERSLPRFVYGGQDICFNQGPMCSPAWLAQNYFPSLRRAIEPLLENDIAIIWHCDGNILPILDLLLDAGVAGFQGFQEEAGVSLERMAALKTKRGRKPILWGSVSVTSTLPHGSVADVKADVQRCFRTAAPGGGFALAPTSSILPDVPLENVLALYQHGVEFGRRFLREHQRA